MSSPDAKLTIEEAALLLLAGSSPYAIGRRAIDGVEFTVFEHGPRNLGMLFALAKRHDHKIQLVYEDERYTFAEVRKRANNLAHHLVNDFGIAKGDRIGLAMRNYPEWCFTYMAATTIGAVIVPLNAWWTGPELHYGLEDSGAKLLIADQERFDRVQLDLASLGVRALIARPSGPMPGSGFDVGPLLTGDFKPPEIDVHPDDDATIMYTSGSTGHPKGVVSTHRAITSAIFTWEFVIMARLLSELPPPLADRMRAWMSGGANALASFPFEMPESTMLLTVPLFHVTGCNVQFLPAFRNGRKLVMMHRWNAERALELIERERVTDFNGVPTMSWELVNSPDFKMRDTSSLRLLSAGGAARPAEQVRQIGLMTQNVQTSTGYGMTETNSLGTAIGGDDYQRRPTSVGRALPPLCEIKIVGDDGRTLGTDEDGEICIKSVTNMRGYWNKPIDTERTLRDGWIYSGDIGRIDAENFLYITGRSKDIVIRGGENISCGEVEQAIYEHPAAFEVACYGVPDDRLGEALVATVMVRPGMELTEAGIKAHVASRLAQFKVPSRVFVQQEQLPRIASQKFDKRSLRKSTMDRLGLR